MRVLATFALVSMIAGILGGPVVPEPDQTQNGDLKSIRLLQKFTHKYEVRPSEIVRPVVMPEESKTKCRINGGIDAENATVEGLDTFRNSYLQLTNETLIQLETAANALDGGLDSAIEATCNWASTVISLIVNFKHSAGQCWRPKEHTSFNLVQNTAMSVLQYVCSNNGSAISTFLAADGEDCYHSSNSEIESCFRTSFSRDTSLIDYSEGQPHLPWDFPIVSPNTQFCSDFQTFQECIFGVLKKCQNRTPANQIDTLFNIVKRSIGCEDFIKAQI